MEINNFWPKRTSEGEERQNACYGIVKVPSGPWFCCKCRSQERIARVKCELCPSKEGALKRTDTGGWAHVVCALYIPEVRFGDVSTMEPIIFSSVPHERFLKTCYICEESGKDTKMVNGACMNCHKSGCKLSFHVTCAQSKRLLCEEASVNGHVQYVGFCATHWTKRFKQINNNASLSEADVKKQTKDKKARCRNDSTSSTNSAEAVKIRHRKSKLNDMSVNEIKHNNDDMNNKYEAKSPAKGDEALTDTYIKPPPKAAIPNGQAKLNAHSFSVNGLLSNEKNKLSSPLNTPVVYNKDDSNALNSSFDDSQTDNVETDEPTTEKHILKKRKLSDKEKLKKKTKLKTSKLKDNSNASKDKDKKDPEKKKKEKYMNSEKKDKSHSKEKSSDKKRKLPQPSQLGLLENGKVSSWDSVTPKLKETPDNFQEFLEHQWNEGAQFLISKAEHFDVASLLTCLHQLKAENMKLETKLLNLQSRRDRLLGVNARLAASISSSVNDIEVGENPGPLSAMLSKLNDDPGTSSPKPKKSKKLKSHIGLSSRNDKTVASPDLAMLAAASAKFESNTFTDVNVKHDGMEEPDEKPAVQKSLSTDGLQLVQPPVHFQPPTTSSLFANEFLTMQQRQAGHMEFFGDQACTDSHSASRPR